MKTLSPTERRFIAAAEFENAPAHELMIEWTKQTLEDQRKARLFTSLWVFLLVFSFILEPYKQPLAIAATVVWVAGIVYDRVSARRANKQVDEDMQAFLER